jgi:PHD/YefM family antitoxin component YafN of YafNO toxin-antitoxin module
MDNIRSLTDFRRNTKDYVGKLHASNSPLVLTVNGEAALVVQNVQAFQAIQDRLQKAEAEVQSLKLDALTRDLQIGIEQLESGEYTTYTEATAATLVDRVKAKGRAQKASSAG